MRIAFKIYAVSFLCLFASITSIWLLSNYIDNESLKKVIFPLLGYSNPLVILMAASGFHIFMNLPPIYLSFLNKILSSTLFIYLITEIGGFVSYAQIASMLNENTLLALIKCIEIILVCLLTGHIVIWFTSKALDCINRIVRNKNVCI